MDGWMIPERNCARKLASYMRRFWRPNSSIIACRRPKTCTRVCPVCVSSTSPFSVPVSSHWAANWTWERRAMTKVITRASGTTTSAHRGQQR